MEGLIKQVTMPEPDRLKRLPFDKWYLELQDLVETYETEEEDFDKKFESMAVLTNQLSLVCVYQERIDLAERIIGGAINLFLKAGEKYKSQKIRNFAFQPWVNQGRIYRLLGKYEASCKIFSDINMESDAPHVSISGNAIRKESVDDPEILGILRNIYVLDTLKSRIQEGNTDKINDFIGKELPKGGPFTGFFKESQIISECLRGNWEKASEAAISAFTEASADKKPILLLKLACLLTHQGMKDSAAPLFSQLYESNRNKFDGLDLNGLMYMQRLANALFVFGAQDEAEDLLKSILLRNEFVKDEPLNIGALAVLAKTDETCQRRLAFEASRTGYTYLKKRHVSANARANCFPQIDVLSRRVMRHLTQFQ